MTTSTDTESCDRCNGKGYIRAYGHIQNGVCFKCGGCGRVAVRKHRAPRPVTQSQLDYQAEQQRKTEIVKGMYANDARLNVPATHAWYFAHAIELAKLDGIWEKI